MKVRHAGNDNAWHDLGFRRLTTGSHRLNQPIGSDRHAHTFGPTVG